MNTESRRCPHCGSAEVHFRKSKVDFVCDICEHKWVESREQSDAICNRRVFLSYGRLDASPLAARLRDDLEARGYEVWKDTREIDGGNAWEDDIVEGLQNSDVVIAILSPHSVRVASDPRNPDARDSVCLDEISYARFTLNRAIVPLMAIQCEPPFAICRLDYVNGVGWQDSENVYGAAFERLCESLDAAFAGKAQYRSWETQLKPWDFTPFLEEKRRHFCGREWLFREIDEWRQLASE